MSGDGLRFGLLGPLAVTRGDEPVPLAGARRRALLALLVLHARELMTSDRLAEELWVGRPPATARTALQMHIRALRQALGSELPLRTVPGGYVLEIAAEACDVSEFEQRAAAGAAALRAGDPETARRELVAALSLWRGPALGELADEPSARPEAARLEDLRSSTVEARIDADLALGRHADLPGELAALIAEHPYRERLRGQLMLALYRCGRQADALAEYQRARDTLVDELGLDPGEELQRLQQAILAHHVSLDPPPRPKSAAPDIAAASEATPPDALDAASSAPAWLDRRTVIALLAAVHAEADPEDAGRLIGAVGERVRVHVERFGGMSGPLSAGALPAAFGVPAAHEDDAERAVRAALAIRDELRDEPSVHVRVAVATTEALVGEGSDPGDLAGPATWLLSAVSAGSVVVDDRTRKATRQPIEYRLVENGWEALAARTGIREGPPARAPLAGRRAELALLAAGLERVCETRAPALFTVVGPPGIGKSRLLAELDPQGARVLTGRSLPYGPGLSFWALGEMVKRLAGVLESDSTADAGGKLAALVADTVSDASAAEWVLRHATGLVGAGPTDAVPAGDRRAQEFAAWRTLLEALAEERTLILVFEDVHWADDGLLDFIDHLVDWATQAPMLLVTTARPELLERRPQWGGGKPDSTTLTLGPLSADDTAALVAALARGSLTPRQTGELIERSGGNPLYAEQYVEALGESDGGTPDLPDTVRAIIAARLDALPASDRHLLQDAAVIGQVFWPSAVTAQDAEERLRALERRQLVRRNRRSSIAGQPEYGFVHALLREVAYEQIPRAQRMVKHLGAAGWIEALGRPDDHAELLGHHYQQALALSRSAERDLGPVVPEARAALAYAGDRARVLYAFAAAERFYSDALALWPQDAQHERAELIHRRAVAASERGEEDRGEALDQAIEALRASGEEVLVADLARLRADVWWLTGEHDRCWDHLNLAWELVVDAPASPVKARVLAEFVRFDMFAGRYDAERVRAALDITGALGLDELRAHVLISAGTARVGQADDEGFEQLTEGLEAARAGNWLWAVARGATNLCSGLNFHGRAREALEANHEALHAVERLGSPSQWRVVRTNMIEQWAEAGDWELAVPAADEFLAESERLGVFYNAIAVAFVRAMLRLGLGDLDGAIADQAFAVEHARVAKDPQNLYYALAVAVHVHADTGRLDKARERFDELLSLDPAAFRYIGHAGGDVAWAAPMIDRTKPAQRALAAAEWPSFQAARALMAGDAPRAAAIYDTHGAARSAALARLRSGEPAQLHHALEFFTRVGATRYARECERLLVAAL
ncbi:AAA family ATPase [Solirubrobacter ginsenosidimutans]|uniref:AAA family ATPase n=1 Tax=Solirubrobacter ginsenosidimutans TaxID=490573 RepID=A0A9X3MPF4_9ACTN|nr:BTAD domain-containing putative transcriptional regulator [Solirubrobacter ginsenosidimutans]MDA0158838.1 AAA family ATPase [Solirubrobacter ginsenosidimutans]